MSQTILKVYLTKRENASESLIDISSVTEPVANNPKIWVFLSLARKKIEQPFFYLDFFLQVG